MHIAPGKGRLLGYLAFSHGWTWTFWAMACLWGTTIWSPPALWFFLVGGMGVPLGGIFMTRFMQGTFSLCDLARRIVDVTRIAARWWAVILLFFPVLTILAAFLAGASGVLSPLDIDGALKVMTNPANLIGLVAFTLIFGPLPEEIGWRGYFLDQVQSRRSALSSSLIVGFLHWTWHLPLFLLPGYWAAFNTQPSPLDLGLVVLPATILYTWVYNNTGRSVFAVILFHFTGNFSAELFGISGAALTYRLFLTVIAVAIVVWWWGPSTLRRDRQSATSKAKSMTTASHSSIGSRSP